MVSLRKQETKLDKYLLAVTLLMATLGVIAVADASAPQALNVFNDKFYFVKQQIIWYAVGIILLFVASKIKYTFWEKIALPLFFINVLLLIAVLIPNIGFKALGARRWINLGFFSFQPSEIIKFSIILYFAKLAKSKKGIYSYLIPLGLISLLIMLQPDLGTTLVFVAISMILIFLAGVNVIQFIGISVLGIISSFLLIITSSYRKQRLLTYIKRGSDPLREGYHIRQILLSLGLGGFWGVGLGASRQKFLFLPEAAGDSIFAVIAEEMGFIGGSIIIFLFIFYAIRGFRISAGTKDVFAKLLAAGIVSWVSIQAIVNLGAMTAVLPLTGIPLPFFSYGGTSLVMLMLATGILLNISRYAEEKRRKK